MRIGVLTGGGDAPGLNAAIRAIVRKGTTAYGAEVLGFRNGWRGVMEGEVRELTKESVQGILHRGGTILGSSGAAPSTNWPSAVVVIPQLRTFDG